MAAKSKRPLPDPQALLSWYDQHRRHLPWRAGAGERADPYRVWLSEIMLQQTTVATVGPYYQRFLRKWPTVQALAAAPQEAVLAEWAGLGYYARARNLHKAAKAVVSEFGGQFPVASETLKLLPGIGPYTAAAIAAITEDEPVAVVDGNVERVMARLFQIEDSKPALRDRSAYLLRDIVPADRPGDFAQAMMDLGATLCTPKRPACTRCPWQSSCQAHAAGAQETYPRPRPKPEKPLRRGVAFWLSRQTRDGEQVLLQRRPENGLLGGMLGFPTTPWSEGRLSIKQHAPLVADWRKLPGHVKHVFTHFTLELQVHAAQAPDDASSLEGDWVAREKLHAIGLPTVMRKVVRLLDARR